MEITIDKKSGFCFGVVNAIEKAEEVLAETDGALYCLGDIVHNSKEVERLNALGLHCIDEKTYSQLHNATVLLRAHGAPPRIYEIAQQNNLTLVDATCPVVLKLQERIKKAWEAHKSEDAQIVIYGKKGHAEVLGLVGQTQGEAIVIENFSEVEKISMDRPIFLYSQTTKSHDEYMQIVEYIQRNIQQGLRFEYRDTICRQVMNRMPNVRQFAQAHDIIFFVSGKKSSNGRMLYQACKEVNPHTFFIDDISEVHIEDIRNAQSIGICGATSTPSWQMKQIAEYIADNIQSEDIHINY